MVVVVVVVAAAAAAAVVEVVLAVVVAAAVAVLVLLLPVPLLLPLQPGLPAASAAAASPWLLILASFPCCLSRIFFFSFSKVLGSLPLGPHCSPAFSQHLLLPLPYGCSSSQASRAAPAAIFCFSFSKLLGSLPPATPIAARPSRSICCCRFPMAVHPRKLPVLPKPLRFFFCFSKLLGSLPPGPPPPHCRPAFPQYLLRPFPHGCSSLQASRAAHAAICLVFRRFLVPFPPAPPHCSPAFPQHLLLPLPYGCSSSQASWRPSFNFRRFKASPPLLPQHLLLPLPHGCSSSQASCAAQAFFFSKLLGSLSPRPPHCSPAFPQHLLLPLPYGCS